MSHTIGKVLDDKYIIICRKRDYKLIIKYHQLGGIEYCPYCGDILDYSPNIKKALKELKQAKKGNL